MKKSLLALAVLALSGSAFATDPSTVSTSISATYASAGNGGTSVSKASNFTVGFGSASSVTATGILAVTAPNCNVDTTATVIGSITTVKGSATTMSGSTASNVSTGNATGAAFSYGVVQANVAKSVNGVGGTAMSNTETWAGAGKNQTGSSFASQTASFEAKGGTGIVTITTPGHWVPTVIAVGTGAVTSGVSTVDKSYQVVGNTGNSGCGGSCPQNVGQLFNGTSTAWNTANGSDTLGSATTLSNVSVGLSQ